MPLPGKFINVYYYLITRQYNYSGDLVILSENIYYFPRRDLAAERGNSTVISELTRILNDAIMAVADLVNRLHEENLSEEEFRITADAHIEKLKQQRNPGNFSKSLPLPTRFISSEIKNIRLGFGGKLSFSTQHDNHDFEFGLGKKRLLKALREHGFIVKDSRQLFRWR